MDNTWTSPKSAMAHAEKHGPELGMSTDRYLKMAKRRLLSDNKFLIRKDRDANIYNDRDNNVLVVRRRDNKIITFYPRRVMHKTAETKFPDQWEITDLGMGRSFKFLSEISQKNFLLFVKKYISSVNRKLDGFQPEGNQVHAWISGEPLQREDFLLAKAIDILYLQSLRTSSLEAINKAVNRVSIHKVSTKPVRNTQHKI